MTSSTVAKPATSNTGKVVLAIIAILALAILVFVRVPSAGPPLSPSSTSPDGTRAAAQILSDHGISVEEVNPGEARTLAGPHTTLVITPSAIIDDDTREELIDSRATILLLSDVWSEEWGFSGWIVGIDGARLSAECDDPDAEAAQSVGPINWLFDPDDDVDGCFTAHGNHLWVQHEDNPQISYLADNSILTNEHLAKEGNAAFALRKLGSQPNLYWVSGGEPLDGDANRTGMWAGLPSWFFPLLAALALSLGWWVVYRGRRFGKLVAEPLPVVVPASEVNEGRSVLYQRGKNYQHAASALRAGAISRLAKGRGLPDDASPDVVIATLARASGYPPSQVADLLYERPISGDSDLIKLAAELDRFERDTHVQ